jgi:uncharacterized protein (DUF2062 family)
MPVIEHVNHHNMGRMLSQLWGPLLLGALFLGVVSAAIGYVLAQLLWRIRVVYLIKQRRARLELRRPALGENSVD